MTTLRIATHDGPFHADEVLAVALLRRFVDPTATVVRSRNPARWAEADVLADVGGEHQPARMRFDHHQASYEGSLSSAGMVLAWLEAEGRVDGGVAQELRAQVVDFVDAVDNGRRTPEPGSCSFPAVVGLIGEQGESPAELDALFETAASVALWVVDGVLAGCRKVHEAREIVREAMDEAAREGRAVVLLDRYLKWKRPYFEHGGAAHPTAFVGFPGEGDYRIVAVPPDEGSMGQKRPLPAAWAGLTGEALSAVVGVAGARFCHKNRFIAVFDDRDAALRALSEHGLDRPFDVSPSGSS